MLVVVIVNCKVAKETSMGIAINVAENRSVEEVFKVFIDLGFRRIEVFQNYVNIRVNGRGHVQRRSGMVDPLRFLIIVVDAVNQQKSAICVLTNLVPNKVVY